MRRAFLYRLYPTQDQEVLLENTLETLRHLYNNALAQRIDAYKHEKQRLNYVNQANQLPALKQSGLPIADIYSQVLQDCLKRLDKAYQNFFRRVKSGREKPGFPRFKGRGRYRSFTYPAYGAAAQMDGNKLHLSKIGDISIRQHRPLEGFPKTCTISRKADGWYCCLACECEVSPLLKTGLEVGMDVGITDFATLSGEYASVPNPRPLKKALGKLRKAQKRLERRTRRDPNRKLASRQSHRRAKAKVLLAKAHQKVARTRRDFHHKTAHALVNQFDVLYVEHLNIGGMLKNHPLAQAISDAGWGQFFSVLNSQAEKAAKQVVEVCPYNTSQNCSQCGSYVPKSLSVRTHTCPFCGLVLHRDKNAAENIKKNGQGRAISEQGVVRPCEDLRSPRL